MPRTSMIRQAERWSVCLGAGGGDDRVGDEAESKPEQDSPGDQFLEFCGAGHREQFDDDVKNGATRQRQEGDGEQWRADLLADDGPEEGRATPDETEQNEPSPRRAL